MTRPSLLSLDAWGRHERLCTEVLDAALHYLPLPDPAEQEDDINRRLYRLIIQAAREREVRDGITFPVVTYEGRNPPLMAHPQRAAREHKRPDFFWGYHDPEGDEPVRHFVAECKRLGKTGGSRDLSERYVTEGVARFVSPAHGYGEQAPAGAMVGYLHNTTASGARAGVDRHLADAGLPALTAGSSPTSGVARHGHRLDRSFPQSPFRLLHFWREA